MKHNYYTYYHSDCPHAVCYIFTKVLQPLLHYWCAKGIRITLYLDDGLAVALGKQQASEASQLVQTTLLKAGFITHPKKSQWEPVQRLNG